MNYRPVTLDKVPFRAIHACFTRAFADYAVNIGGLSEAGLLRRARKNRWVPELSVGYLAGGELVAITLWGVDEVGWERRAYDICTGIVPGHRGHGLAGRLLDDALPALADAGVRALQLEVLQGNTPAIRAYEKAGFAVVRGLLVHVGRVLTVPPDRGAYPIRDVTAGEVTGLSAQLEFEPSFEQRDFAIRQLAGQLILLGAFDDGRCIAALAHDPETEWIMRLVTARAYRRRGLASALLGELARRLPRNAAIKAVNMDERDQATRAAVTRCGLEPALGQWEMRRALARS